MVRMDWQPAPDGLAQILQLLKVRDLLLQFCFTPISPACSVVEPECYIRPFRSFRIHLNKMNILERMLIRIRILLLSSVKDRLLKNTYLIKNILMNET
jgi:hypothetical protein